MTRRTSPTYESTKQIFLKELSSFVSALESEVQQPHNFRFVSQRQAGVAERSMHAHLLGGTALLKAQPISEADLRAAAYNQASHISELSAFIQVSKVSLFELGTIALSGFQSNELLVPLTLLRGFIERVALCAWLIGLTVP